MAFWKRKDESLVGLVRESQTSYDPVANVLNQVIGGV